MSDGTRDIVSPTTSQWFTSTHWSVVLNARGPDSPAATAALEKLCRTYWGALYAYVRRKGHSPADAADLTQAFFARFLENQTLQRVDRHKGKFRSFLLKILNDFLIDDWRRARAEKRGGTCPVFSINASEWETRYGHELASNLTPEKHFERRWAMALLDQALGRLRDEWVKAGKGRQFDLLKAFLSSPSSEAEYSSVSDELGLRPGTVAVQVHRLRQHYGNLVREEVANTVASPDEVDEEMRHLVEVLSG